MIKELSVVISCPLIIKEKGGNQERIKNIGVLNIQSKIPEAASLFTTENEIEKEVYIEKLLLYPILLFSFINHLPLMIYLL